MTATPPGDPAARLRALERQLERQKAVSRELEKLVEDRTRDLYITTEKLKRQSRLVGARTAIALLGEHGSLEAAAPRMLREFGEQLQWQQLHLWMRDPHSNLLRCSASWGAPEHPAPTFAAETKRAAFARGVGLPGRVWQSGTPAWIRDVTNDANFPRGMVAKADRLFSGCAFPIIVDGDVHAVVEMFANELRDEDDDLLVTFAALGSQIGQSVERTRAEAKLRTRELEIAKRIQTTLLPRTFDVPNLELAATMVPAEDVGGDYYDILPFDGGAWIGIGDVSGHGVGAGMIMIMVQSAVAALTRAATSPRDVVIALNHLLFDNIRRRMKGDDHVTFTLFRYTSDGTLRFAGAHEDFILYRAATGRCEVVETAGTWLAAKASVDDVTPELEVKLAPGDIFVLYTDGIVEARSVDRKQFGMQRLVEEVQALGALPDIAVERICDAIVGRALAWGGSNDDDLSVVAMRYLGSG